MYPFKSEKSTLFSRAIVVKLPTNIALKWKFKNVNTINIQIEYHIHVKRNLIKKILAIVCDDVEFSSFSYSVIPFGIIKTHFCVEFCI